MAKLSIGVNVHLCEPHKFHVTADPLSDHHFHLTVHGTEHHYPNLNIFFDAKHADKVRAIAALLNEIASASAEQKEAA